MPRPDVSEERRKQILAAAAEVFARLGLREARMDDIVAATGLSKGTLYWYFKNKDDLTQALLHRLFLDELKQLQDLQTRDGPVGESLLHFMRQYTQQLMQISPLLSVVLDSYALSTRNIWIHEILQDYYRSFREEVEALIRRGIERGEFRTVSTGEVATALVALVEGITLTWMIDSQGNTLEEQGQMAVKLLLDGLRRPSWTDE